MSYGCVYQVSKISTIFICRDYCPKQGPIDTQDCRPQQGPANATINRRCLIRYQVDVLVYACRDRFGPLRILSYCYYYWLICVLCLSPLITNPWVRLVLQRRTPLTFLPKNRPAGRDSPGYDSTRAISNFPGYKLSGVKLRLSPYHVPMVRLRLSPQRGIGYSQVTIFGHIFLYEYMHQDVIMGDLGRCGIIS